MESQDYKVLHLKLRLGESLVMRRMDDSTRSIMTGVRLLTRASLSLAQEREQCYMLPLLFEGLGWIYFSGLTKTDVYASSMELVRKCLTYLDKEKNRMAWRLSADQVLVYSDIARLALDAKSINLVDGIMKRVDILGEWMELPRDI